ncbi:aspartate dehydrogenase domain-containing protein [Actinocorallia sp. A-T 12471]|uniref:aspartate dehydrogenase domain-containing protein n=1 Tax=Actinocorallia sp. A-T 12471 TaxID=3089813 RepID=UPI0029D37D66|nr:aspartate dehydrogenase domain-containing protein [Actinocorallia sp. A-T 12471]MDX6739571.1 aspartate dehydrogenase domain-containing protein [Actinocorallia sp. A-T 12471]
MPEATTAAQLTREDAQAGNEGTRDEATRDGRGASGRPRAVAVLGWGAIGSVVGARLLAGAVPGARLECVVARGEVDAPVPVVSADEAIARADVLVECAGHAALAAHGLAALSAGVDVVVSSVGALIDAGLRAELEAARPGRLHVTTGALGGLDLLVAASLAAPFTSVRLTTTKTPRALVQDWMDDDRKAELRAARGPVTVFRGSAEEAAPLFPKSLNVAATLALSLPGTPVEVELVADPDAALVTHVVTAEGPVGSYRFEVQNRPSPANPRTSQVVPYAVLRTLQRAL